MVLKLGHLGKWIRNTWRVLIYGTGQDSVPCSVIVTATGWTVRVSNPFRGEIFHTCPDRPWGSPSHLYNECRVFPGSKIGRGLTLSSHPLLVPWSWKGRAIPLLPLWAVRPVQSLSACTGVTFTFTFYLVPCYKIKNALGKIRAQRHCVSPLAVCFVFPLCLLSPPTGPSTRTFSPHRSVYATRTESLRRWGKERRSVSVTRSEPPATVCIPVTPAGRHLNSPISQPIWRTQHHSTTIPCCLFPLKIISNFFKQHKSNCKFVTKCDALRPSQWDFYVRVAVKS